MIRSACVALVVSIGVCAGSAFAQEVNETAQVPADSPRTATSGVGMDANGQSNSGAPGTLTRADVEQELIRVERNGDLQRLYSTVYKGGG